tara:strand:+ start:80 stop:385 length:306 start_codon:yes stop_codon:yes gene_type:complete
MAKSKQSRRLYKVENTPVKETPRYEGDGTEWIFESPDGGKTVYKRAMGSDEKILVNGSGQLELFPEYQDEKEEGLYPWHNNKEEDEEQEWPGLDAINKEWV